MYCRELETLLEKANNVISELRCTLQEDFDDVFIVVYIQIHEELRIEEMDKEKLDRETKEQEELDEKM
jgi:hypothetical protein